MTTQHGLPPDDGDEAKMSATPEATRAAGLRLSARGYSTIRHVLVQNHEDPRPSVLGEMVRKRRHRALVLYLELLTWWPWLKSNHQPLSADVWIRSLTAADSASSRALTWSPSTLSRTWRELEELGLIEPRRRSGRLTRVTPRREDGQGTYIAPSGGKDKGDRYFVLPDGFWVEGWFATLSFPALATLLILLKETSNKPETWLPREKMSDWYGISGRTVQKGLTELEERGLVKKRSEVVAAPLSPNGITRRVHYSLTGPFSLDTRMSLRRTAAKARNKRREQFESSDSASVTP
jgi:DNA-binding transcriptional regulator YhcF (GntR family)